MAWQVPSKIYNHVRCWKSLSFPRSVNTGRKIKPTGIEQLSKSGRLSSNISWGGQGCLWTRIRSIKVVESSERNEGSVMFTTGTVLYHLFNSLEDNFPTRIRSRSPFWMKPTSNNVHLFPTPHLHQSLHLVPKHSSFSTCHELDQWICSIPNKQSTEPGKFSYKLIQL